MISKLGALRFVTETYMQSLGHRQAKGLDVALDEKSEGVIDDAYILASVKFSAEYGDSPVERVLIGERPWKSRYIRKNTGAFEQLFPEGFLAMFFVDLYGFDADRYSLVYKGRENLLNTECLLFSVSPASEKDSGAFRGEVWIDSSSYGIVRIKGVFTGPYRQSWYRGSRDYFHFDSWRENVGNGWWAPSAASFAERRVFRSDGNLEFHFRGYVLLWQQQKDPAQGPHSSSKEDDAETASAPQTLPTTVSQNGLVARLDADGLLAMSGEQEHRLDRIVHQIAPISGMGTHKITCRVLLTTPAEMFAVGDVIVVSRGLLSLVPNDSILAFMVARQVAHIVLGHTGTASQPLTESLFDLGENKTFTGLGMRWKADEEAAADSTAIVLVRGTQYETAVADTAAFLAELKSQSHRFPNLVRARFGVGVISEVTTRNSKEAAGTAELRFDNRYRVSLNRVVIGPESERDNPKGTAVRISQSLTQLSR
jgi:hypothetical protein